METSVIIVQTRRRGFLGWLWHTIWNLFWFAVCFVLFVYVVAHA